MTCRVLGLIRQSALCITLFALSTSPLLGAGLLDYVTRDAGLCLRIDDPAKWVADWNQGPLKPRLESTSIYQTWSDSEDVRKLRSTIASIDELLGTSLAESVLNLAGTEVVLAVYPQAPDRPAGVLLMSPRDLKEARELVALWNRLDGADVSQMEESYWKRSPRSGSTLFYVLRENLFALSDREDMIRRIATETTPSEGDSIQATASWQRALASLEECRRALVYFRPELWKGVISKPSETDSFEGFLFRQLALADSVALGVNGPADLHARCNLLYKPDREPQGVIDYRTRYQTGSAPIEAMPPETLVTVTGRGGPEYLGDFLRNGVPGAKDQEQVVIREVLRGLLRGRDPYDDVLSRVGQSWRLDVRDRPDDEIPLGMTLRLSMAEPEPSDRVPLHQSLSNIGETFMRIFSQLSPLSMGDVERSQSADETAEFHFDAKHGLSPTLRVTPTELTLVSSQPLLDSSKRSPKDSPPTARLLSEDAHFQIAIRTDRLRETLVSKLPFFARASGTTPDDPDFRQSWNRLAESVGLFDSILYTLTVRPAELRMELRGAVAAPSLE